MPEVAPGSDAPVAADERLLAAHDLARQALLEITPDSTIGPVVGHVVEGEHVLSLLFECTLSGYPGWHWTVSLARVDDGAEPVVLEAELLPGEDALLAPDWVPWSERLAEYQAAQEAARAAASADGEHDAATGESADEDEVDDDDDDDDDDELDLVGDDDIDGIDIDLHGDEPDVDGPDADEPDPEVDADEPEVDVAAEDITGAETAALDDRVSGDASE